MEYQDDDYKFKRFSTGVVMVYWRNIYVDNFSIYTPSVSQKQFEADCKQYIKYRGGIIK
jgi:hypothetical protein